MQSSHLKCTDLFTNVIKVMNLATSDCILGGVGHLKKTCGLSHGIA